MIIESPVCTQPTGVALPTPPPERRQPWFDHWGRDAGFGIVALAATGLAVPLGLDVLAGLGVALISLVALHLAARDAGDYVGAAGVRLVRFGFAAILVALVTAQAWRLEHASGSAVRAVGVALVACGLAFLWSEAVRRAGARRAPVRVAALGGGPSVARLALDFARTPPQGFVLVGRIEDGDAAVEGDGTPLLGSIDDLAGIVSEHAIDVVVLTATTGRLEALGRVLDVPGHPPTVMELSELYERSFGRVLIDHINAAWFLDALQYQRRTGTMRRLLDGAFAAIVLTALLPLLALVALLIKLDSRGPVLYRQRRVGEAGREFAILKFRSMRTDAEAAGAVWASKDDPRVTRLGRFLRKSRLDELPQLWNVVRGEMALVGPRPERPEFVGLLAQEIPFFEPRHLIRPGVTGWAQIYAPYGASVDDAAHKLSYDLYYLKHACVTTDLGIVLRTIAVMVGGVGAR